jgi:TetR/AcrR family transcriptional regulator, transcriptional repressor for nem operon
MASVPWEKQFDVDAARERAMATFWARGYKATSMQELLDAMGIQRGSFYDTFGSKRDILLDSLRRYDADRAKAFAELRHERTSVQAIEALFRRIADGRGSRGGPRGCFLVASASELAPGDPEVAAIVNRAFADIESFLLANIEEGMTRREIAASLDAGTVARALLGMLLGMQVLARSGADRKVLASIADQAIAMLAGPKRKKRRSGGTT